MSDVSVVLLTTGEPTTACARKALATQSLALRDIITIEGVTPFHRALNRGARQVTTPFFVQVDADMILDPDAVERLRSNVTDDAGIVVGRLRDAMIGEVVGVRLFRTACFEDASLPDSIAPDTDFGRAIAAKGWRTVEVPNEPRGGHRTLGTHERDYRSDYTFQKFGMLGARYRYRDHPGGLRWCLGQLNPSRHVNSHVAVIALCNGVFDRARADMLVPLAQADQTSFTILQELLAGNGAIVPVHLALGGEPEAQFDRFFRMGRNLCECRAAATYFDLLERMRQQPVRRVWIAQLAFCRAPFAESACREWEGIADFVTRESPASFLQRVRRSLGWH